MRDHESYDNVLTMTLNDYQKAASETAFYAYPIIYTSLGLASETGELLGKVKKAIRDNDVRFDGTKELPSALRADLAAELGDCFWYVAMIAKDLNISLNDIGMMNLEKLQSRQKRGKLKGSGDNR
jgi:NTP pyrophosphatase (non-canonical NTP hydrolase)|tara:strand:+ start:18 stop:392 length:375 start_codon:yes stop_codon:yes gene_type:complete